MRGLIEWRRPTFPGITQVSSALADFTTLFGMGRGVPRRYNHLKIFILHSFSEGGSIHYVQVHDSYNDKSWK